MDPPSSIASLSIQLWSAGAQKFPEYFIPGVSLSLHFPWIRMKFCAQGRADRCSAGVCSDPKLQHSNGAGPAWHSVCYSSSNDIKFSIHRYVTGVVMDGALRAPGLMADIVQVLVALIMVIHALLGRKDNNQRYKTRRNSL